MLSNRDMAPLLLLAAFLAIAWWRWPDTRRSLAAVGRSFLQRAIVVMLVVFTLWCAALTWAAWRVGIWEPALTGVVIVWWFNCGLPLLFTMQKFTRERGRARSTIKSTIGATTLFAFFAGINGFSLVAELALVAGITLLALTVELAKFQPEIAPAHRPASTLLAIIGWSILTYSLWKLIVDREDVDWPLLAMSFATPIWLTLGALAPVAALATYSGYQDIFNRAAWHSTGGFGLTRRLGVIAALGLRPSIVGTLGGHAHVQLGREATGLRSAFRLARTARREASLPPVPKPWTYDQDDPELDEADPHDYFLATDADSVKLGSAIAAAQDDDPRGRERIDQLIERMRARHDRQLAITGFTSEATLQLLDLATGALAHAHELDIRGMALARRRLPALQGELIAEIVERTKE